LYSAAMRLQVRLLSGDRCFGIAISFTFQGSFRVTGFAKP
jgi:hypothetical protein